MNPEPIQQVITRLHGVRARAAGTYEARCPAHDDRRASLSVTAGDDGRVLLHCHAGCSPIEVCQAMGMRMGDLFPRPRKNGIGVSGQTGTRIVATYDYTSADGELLYQVVRLEPKRFLQRKPDISGSGGWNWKLNGTPRVLYRLPELLAATDDAWVFVVEGEKDADRLASLGMVATTCPQGAGKWCKLADDSALDGRRVAIVPDNDEPGERHASDVATRLCGRAMDVRVVRLPNDAGVKDVSDWLDAGGTREQLLQLVEHPAEDCEAAGDAEGQLPVRLSGELPGEFPGEFSGEKPLILIDTDEHRVVDETLAALARDRDIYQRGAMLVRVVRVATCEDDAQRDKVERPSGSPTIQALPAANLRERMTRVATFVKHNRKGDALPAHPTPWLVSAIDVRGDWPGIRPLAGVSDAPVLRRDGGIFQTPGYDARTGVLYQPAGVFPAVHDDVNEDDADVALGTLLEAVCDFPFETKEHQAAWLAGLLTPLARFAFRGPAPMFLIDANVRGAGKGLLAQTIGRIVLGREMPVSTYAHESEEMRKRITAIAIAGDRMVLLDNLEGAFGNDAIDRALTTTYWKDRLLGRSEEVELPLLPTWYATGNNVQVAADTARRLIHIRLDVLDENPEERRGFRHTNLMAWIDANRPALLAAGLTILSAYLKRGAVDRSLAPFGSFEGWSDVVRQAVVWLGLPDPCATRARLADAADTTVDALGQFIAAWRAFAPDAGYVISQLLNRLYPAPSDFQYEDPNAAAMRAAIENLVGCPPGRTPTPRQVGNKLRQFRRRVIDGVYLDCQKMSRNERRWSLCNA